MVRDRRRRRRARRARADRSVRRSALYLACLRLRGVARPRQSACPADRRTFDERHRRGRHHDRRRLGGRSGRRSTPAVPRAGRLLPVRQRGDDAVHHGAGRPRGQARARFSSCAARAAASPIRTRASSLEHIGAYYDDEYIAHRKKRDWGLLTPLFDRAMNQLDADKDRLVSPLRVARRPAAKCSTSAAPSARSSSGCATRYGARVAGVDFKDLSARPVARATSSFTAACSTTRDSRTSGSTSSRCGTSSSTTTIRCAACETARRVLKPDGPAGHRSAAPRQPHVPLVRRSLAGPAGAAAHRALRSRHACCAPFASPGFEVVDYLPVRRVPGVLLPLHRRGVPPAERARAESRRGDLSRTSSGQVLAAAVPAVREAAQPRHADGRLPEGAMSRRSDPRRHAGDCAAS